MNNKRSIEGVPRQMHTCKAEVGLIADYLAARLDPTVLAVFEEHLDHCADCTAFLNTYKKTIEATKSYLKINSLKICRKALGVPTKGSGLLATIIFWLHLLSSNIYLTTGYLG